MRVYFIVHSFVLPHFVPFSAFMSFLSDCPGFSLLGLLFPHLELPSPCEPLGSCFCWFCRPLNQACLLRLGSTSVCSVHLSVQQTGTHTHTPQLHSSHHGCVCVLIWTNILFFFFPFIILGYERERKRAFGFHYISAAVMTATGRIFRFYQLPKSFRGF